MPLPASVVVGILELAKLGLQTWFQSMRMAGKSEEEVDAMYYNEKAEFEALHPDKLPDVPADSDATSDGQRNGGGDTVADAGPETPT